MLKIHLQKTPILYDLDNLDIENQSNDLDVDE